MTPSKPPPEAPGDRATWSTQHGSALLTDFYQLTMLQSYFEAAMDDMAVFEFFVRRLPAQRGFLVAAGLEQVLDYLENLKFQPAELEWLKARGDFSADFVDYLGEFRFRGDVHAMPEGTVFFPGEPILRVRAPLAQAQLIESRVINLLHFQTLIASKAARCVLAAPGKLLVDFGMRRSHGAEAGMLAARAAYLAGFAGSATVLAGRLFGIPLFGTMAHSYIEAHESESAAFESFARTHPDNTVLLIDTYDTERAAHKVVGVAHRLAEHGIRIKAVRLDSGDLAHYARRVRAILDDGGSADIEIFASGNLDEYKVAELLRAGAPIDGFGIGTHLDVSLDAPSLDCAYKLQEYAGLPRRKRSPGKETLPGAKQVFRRVDEDGIRDTVCLEEERHPGVPLLGAVMENGRRTESGPDLESIRTLALRQLEGLPERLRELESDSAHTVAVSKRLRELARAVDRRLELEKSGK